MQHRIRRGKHEKSRNIKELKEEERNAEIVL